LVRFRGPALDLSLEALLKELRRKLAWALLAAVGAHILLFGLGWQETSRPGRVRPLTTKFVKREPRLVKPLELRKRPRPKRRIMRRKVTLERAKLRRLMPAEAWEPVSVLDAIVKPHGRVERSLAIGSRKLELPIRPGTVWTEKDPKEVVDLSLDLVDLDALDTGKYQAMVIVDPRDKKKVKGFLHLGQAYPKSVIVAMSMADRRLPGESSLHALVNAMNKYTGIKTDMGDSYTFDSAKLFKTPLVLTVATWFSLIDYTDSEAANLGKYLLSGGFLIADTRGPGMGEHRPGITSLRNFIIAAFESQGMKLDQDWQFERLPNSHQIYHCFFDFNDGPPGGGDVIVQDPVLYLEGVEVDGRLVLIFSKKALAAAWGRDGDNTIFDEGGGIDNTRQLQFGVNLIIFALTQEGSITHQVMRSVQY